MISNDTGGIRPKRALVSVSDKTNLVELCKFLHEFGTEIVSTGGTAKVLKENGIPYVPIEQVTGNPEAFAGRMKTISFEIGSALLYRRDHPEDVAQAKALGIEPIDLVVCNLYPFEKTAREKRPLPDLIENIDIGGPTMIRAAAKNHEHVICLSSPDDYPNLMTEMTLSASVSRETRKKLALRAFAMIASYDLSIAIELTHQMGSALRYGENPHQRATLLQISNTDSESTLARAKFLQGKELSYNNLLDADQAYKCCSEVKSANPSQSVCVIVKHGTPCGVAAHPLPLQALKLAWEADSISAFGGILCFSEEVTAEIAHFLRERFIEVVIAPKFSNEFLQIMAAKKNVRVLQTELKKKSAKEWTARSINGGLLCQDEDQGISQELRNVTVNAFPEKLLPVAGFGLAVTKYLKSNCIGIFAEKAGGMVILSSGVGQPNRLDCITRLIQTRLAEKQEDLTGAVLVSDAFFPFRDSIDAAKALGISAIVQPGGSIKDAEVIEACDEFKISMLLTGMRHFRH